MRNCQEGLETWSERRVAKLLGVNRAELWRWKLMAELPKDLFEALLATGPSSRELANIALALRGNLMREVERCPHCGGLLRVRNVCTPEQAEIVKKWLGLMRKTTTPTPATISASRFRRLRRAEMVEFGGLRRSLNRLERAARHRLL